MYFLPHCSGPIISASPLVFFRKEVDICSENCTKYINTLYGQNAQFLSVTDGDT